jgi:hypothetical protein
LAAMYATMLNVPFYFQNPANRTERIKWYRSRYCSSFFVACNNTLMSRVYHGQTLTTSIMIVKCCGKISPR